MAGAILEWGRGESRRTIGRQLEEFDYTNLIRTCWSCRWLGAGPYPYHSLIQNYSLPGKYDGEHVVMICNPNIIKIYCDFL